MSITVEDIERQWEESRTDRQLLKSLSVSIGRLSKQVKRDLKILREGLNRVRAVLIVVAFVVAVLSFALGFLVGRITAPRWYLLHPQAIQGDPNGGAWVYLLPARSARR